MILLSSPTFVTNFHPAAGDALVERVRARTRELALDAGRAPPHVLQVDYEQAKREVMGETAASADGWDAENDEVDDAMADATGWGFIRPR